MKKKKKKKKHLYLRMTIACVGIGLLTLAPVLLERFAKHLPLKVRSLRVTGLRVLSAIDLRKIAGIEKGDPLFGKWIKDAPEKLSKNPRIENVSVVRHMSGEVEINVSERQAEAIVNFDELYFVDAAGIVLEKVRPSTSENIDLVVLTGPWSGLRPSDDFNNEVRDGLRLMDAFMRGGLKEKEISEVHLSSKSGWVIYRVGSDAKIVVGRDRFGTKARRLVRILRDFKGREIIVKEIDLDFRDRAVVKLKAVI